MPTRIDKIVLEGFRGASRRVELILDTRKPLVMLFGESGTGKSTILDAFDMIANGSAGSLSERSSTSVREHLPTIGRSPNDVSVSISAGSNSWTATLSGSRIAVSGPTPRPRAHVLRRSQLLTLIEAQPAQRYQELSRFIDVTNVERCEQALRDAVTAVNNELTEVARQIQDARDALHQLWLQEGQPGTDARTWAAAKAVADQNALRTKATRLSQVATKIESLQQRQAELTSAESGLRDSESGLRSVQERIAQSPGIDAAEAISLVALLTQARDFVEPPRDVTTCPVCEQRVDPAALRESLSRRLDEMTSFQNLAAELRSAQDALGAARALNERSRASFDGAVRELALSMRDADSPAIRALAVEWGRFAQLLDGTGEPGSAHAQALELANILLPAHAAVVAERDAAQTDLNQYGAIKGHHDRLVQAETTATSLETLQRRMTRALQIVHAKRITFTQGILDAVAGECNRLYSRIHPGESLGDSRLRLDEQRRASLLQEAQFEGYSGVPPQAYFSESHLDTLGFCVWLAIAKRDDPANAIMLLDDVFTSVDAAHLTRIVDLLSDECQNFAQVIVATHYRNWRDRYRVSQGPGTRVQLLELHRWTLNRGIGASTTRLAVDELADKLGANPLDRQAVSSLSGILLESVLDCLALIYRRPVPRTRDGDYTLGELLDAWPTRHARSVRVMPSTTPVASSGGPSTVSSAAAGAVLPTLDDRLVPIRALNFIRNQVGCHFNMAGAAISDADVEAFGAATVELARFLACRSCGEMARREAGTHFTCSCGATRMEPLDL